MSSVHEILSSIGYQLTDTGREYRARPLYRESDNSTVLSIKKDTGYWYDFKTLQNGPLQDLVELTLGLEKKEAEKWMEDRKWNSKTIIVKPKLDEQKIFPESILDEMVKDYSYWEDRGINSWVVEVFQGGVIQSGRMKDRFVFPIFNSKKQIVGLSGRTLIGSKIKWKHLGDKSKWAYPAYMNSKILLREKEVILIESIGDMLSLWQAGIYNCLVIFGLDINNAILNLLLKISPDKIYIGLNNDSQKNSAGNEAAKKLNKKLLKYFDNHQIQTVLPDKNDFGEMTTEEILSWTKKINIFQHQE